MKYKQIISHNFFHRKGILIFLITSIAIFSLSSCQLFEWMYEDFEKGIVYQDVLFINKTSDPITVITWRFDDEMAKYYNMKFFYDYHLDRIKKIDKNEVCQDYRIPMPPSPQRSAQFIILKKETIEKYSKEEIIEKNIYDYRYVFPEIDLEEMGFEINFTGGDELDKYRIE